MIQLAIFSKKVNPSQEIIKKFILLNEQSMTKLSAADHEAKLRIFYDELNDAWRARAEQDLHQVMDIMSGLKVELKIPLAKFNERYPFPLLEQRLTEVPSTIFRCLILETLVLWASVLRAEKDKASSERILDYVSVYFETLDSGPGRNRLLAKLSQERGINSYISGDFTTALEYFITQARYQDTILDQWSASMNALLCTESLGLPSQRFEDRAEDAKNKLVITMPSCPAEIISPLADYRRRVGFWQGNIAAALEAGDSPSSYTLYLQRWMQSLPWHTMFQDMSQRPQSMQTLTERSSGFYLQEYRMRTLLGRSHPDDVHVMPIADLTIRIYVWTWTWLLGPEKFDVQKIINTLASPRLLSHLSELAPPHKFMLRAYFTPSRTVVSLQSGQPFHSNPDTCFTQSGQWFH